MAAIEETSCDLCGAKLEGHRDKSPQYFFIKSPQRFSKDSPQRFSKDSLQQTWAWLITSILLYLPANFSPIMRTRFFGQVTDNTILGGVVTLWEHASYPIAIIVFVASVLVPMVKIVVLGWLCLSVQRGSTFALLEKAELYRVTEFIGRWSMIDVFVVSILVALIQLGNVMSILPGIAALAFSAMVVTSMLAAIAFDPRLLWEGANKVQLERSRSNDE
ncbi:MAG: paraquat-inducible protein A [Pseudomonadales bacterium]|nr:paraquat-inducible protein A [Pseudomonadales bacterium]